MSRLLIRNPLALAMLFCALAPMARAEADHPALRTLLPLVEVYAAGADTPGYDVAGLRCAGLLLAQYDWAGQHPDVTGPTEADMQQADRMLEASEQQRLNDGMDLVRAHVTIEREMMRVWKLYDRHFARNDRQGRHPWLDDPLISGDTLVCDALPRPE